jgi:hypothetical protein
VLSRKSVLALPVVVVLVFMLVPSAPAFSEGDTSETEVLLQVERVDAGARPAGSKPQYLCSATLQRVGGEVLSNPRIQVLEGIPASVATTTDSGIKVFFKILVSASNRASYEIEIMSAGGAIERHRATIEFPQARR